MESIHLAHIIDSKSVGVGWGCNGKSLSDGHFHFLHLSGLGSSGLEMEQLTLMVLTAEAGVWLLMVQAT